MTIRTDLAEELRGEYMKEYSKEHEGEPDGIVYRQSRDGSLTVSRIDITNENGARALGKPVGSYVTLNIGKLRLLDSESFDRAADAVCEELDKLLDDGSTLVVGLGNRCITADSVGPAVAGRVIATRHLKLDEPEIFKAAQFGEASVLVPGVLAQTGIEAFDLIKQTAERIKPERIIIIDSLAAKSAEALGVTVQITDAGICPGSGVGNDRGELSEKTLGVKTVAVGVPMIVDAATLICDLLDGKCKPDGELLQRTGSFYVCPNDTDAAVREISKIIAYGINRCCHRELTYSDMAFM